MKEFITATIFILVVFGVWSPISYFVNKSRFKRLTNPCAEDFRDFKRAKKMSLISGIITIIVIIGIAIYTFLLK